MRRLVSSAVSASLASSACSVHRQLQSSWTGSSSQGGKGRDDDDMVQLQDLHSELASVIEEVSAPSVGARDPLLSGAPHGSTSAETEGVVRLTKLPQAPAKFDLIGSSFAYEWRTTAKHARKVIGPMREWATELKYRTGVHLEMDPTYPVKLSAQEYASADDVDITVYLFGTDRGVSICQPLMEAAVQQDPAYVRLGVFRRHPTDPNAEVEWLMLRRINRDNRPPDIPKISLKLPGKYTLFHENYKEAAMRTLWEETGITVASSSVFPTGMLMSTDPNYFWRVPVRYFVAEVPYDVPVLGPRHNAINYMQGWDARILRQSPDLVDREWAKLADPVTGCAWMPTRLIDELQKPLRGTDYMSIRYTPPPHSKLQEVVRLAPTPAEGV